MIKLKDIIRESKRLNLFEQAAIELPPVNFDKTFVDNYAEVTPGSWEGLANQLIATLKDYRDNKGYLISKLEIDIQGGSSDVPASNIYTGTSKPTHNYGGLMNTYNLKWVKPGQPGGSNIEPDEKNNEGEIIKKGGTEGNKWLANARAKALQAVLIPYIEKALGEKMNSKVVASQEDRKFANAQIRSAVKPAEPDFDLNLITFGGGYTRPGLRGTFMVWATNKTGVSAGDLQDFGRGEGVPVYLTKELAQKFFKLDPAREKLPASLGSFGGDPVDYELALWNYYNSTPGFESNAANQKAFAYVDVKTGKFLNNVKRPLVYDKNKKNEKGRIDYKLSNPPNPDPRKQIQ